MIGHFVPSRLIVATLAPESTNFLARGVSYLFADLRHLPFATASFDQVLCISVLEHVGMDNRVYGSSATATTSPEAEAQTALSELQRILRPGGRLLLSVPFGQRTTMGWQRQFDRNDLDLLLSGISASAVKITVYARDAGGWQLSSLESAAQCSYANGAHAVACVDVMP